MLIFQYQCKKCYSVFEEAGDNSKKGSSPVCLYCGSKDVKAAEKSLFIKERDCIHCDIKGSCEDCKSHA